MELFLGKKFRKETIRLSLVVSPKKNFSSLSIRPRNIIIEFPFLMAIALRLGTGFLCVDWPCAENLELKVSMVHTSIYATHVSILIYDISSISLGIPS